MDEALHYWEKTVFLYRKIYGKNHQSYETYKNVTRFRLLILVDFIKRIKETILKPLIESIKKEDWDSAIAYHDIGEFYLEVDLNSE